MKRKAKWPKKSAGGRRVDIENKIESEVIRKKIQWKIYGPRKIQREWIEENNKINPSGRRTKAPVESLRTTKNTKGDEINFVQNWNASMKELLNHVRLNEILKVGIRNKETKLGDLVGLRSEEMKKSKIGIKMTWFSIKYGWEIYSLQHPLLIRNERIKCNECNWGSW